VVEALGWVEEEGGRERLDEVGPWPRNSGVGLTLTCGPQSHITQKPALKLVSDSK
jgi:hypothetical protein